MQLSLSLFSEVGGRPRKSRSLVERREKSFVGVGGGGGGGVGWTPTTHIGRFESEERGLGGTGVRGEEEGRVLTFEVRTCIPRGKFRLQGCIVRTAKKDPFLPGNECSKVHSFFLLAMCRKCVYTQDFTAHTSSLQCSAYYYTIG